MNAAQMLAAAGEPNTTEGRAKFHQRFPSKAAFDAWYNSKKEYGGGLTDGIAFPQQPDASSNRAPYYEKGGFFAPNVMPWNGPMGFYEHGGLHKYQFAGNVQQFLGTDPNNYYTERDQAALQGQQNFGNQGFDYEGPITRPGYSFPPAVTPSPYTPYIPGLKLGEDSDRNPNVNIGTDDPRTRKKHPSGGGGSSRHHQPIGKQISRWWDKNFQGKGGRKYDVARCWGGKCHEYGGMTDGIAFPQQPTDHINFSAFPWQPQYDMGGMNYNMGGLPMNDNGEPCYECGGNMAYGGYMQTGGTTQIDQGQYTNDMTQRYLKSLSDFSMAAQPMPMGNAQEAGYAAYGTVVDNNQMSDFNTLDMNNINNTSLMQTQLDELKNNRSNTFTNLLNVPANMAANTYLKKPTYTTETVGSGYARYGGNMFRNGGLKKYAPGGTSIPGYTNEEVAASDDWFAKQVAESAANEAENNYYKQISGTNQGTTAGNTAGTTTNTNVGNTNDNAMGDTRMTADELAYFRGMMRGSNQGNYAPSWQAQQNQNNGYDAWKAMSKDPEALKKFLSNSGIQDMKWNNKMGIFGPKSKGHVTFRTYGAYDPSTGKIVTAPSDQAAASGQPGADQQMQKGPKGPGFIQNLIAKNKQRKADKNISKEQKLRMIADQEKMMMPTPDTYQGELAKSQQMPLTGEQRKKQFFDAKLAQDLNNPNYGNRTPTQSSAIPFNPGYQPAPQIGFEYGGFPQYNYGGYSAYDQGGMYNPGDEAEMTDDEIANYLAMGGTLEYLD